MKLIDIFENDAEHFKTLKQTGFWGKAGAGGIVVSTNTSRILLGLRSSLVEQPHTWGGFGGAIDSSENSENAALREIKEETGLNSALITNVIKSYVFNHPKTGFRYTNYIVEVKDEFKPILNWENVDAQWFPVDSLPDNLHFGLQSLLNSTEFKRYWSEK